jgi:hypothetical protein
LVTARRGQLKSVAWSGSSNTVITVIVVAMVAMVEQSLEVVVPLGVTVTPVTAARTEAGNDL